MSHSDSTEAKRNILFAVCGSIAAYKSAHIVSRLAQAGHDVQVVMTPSALQFVGAATFEGLTGRTVLSDTFTPGRMMDHIHLARWANLMVICPATANTINKLAHGIGDDLVGTLHLAFERHKKIIIAPAMNSVMLSHPSVQKSFQTLRDQGALILPTATGQLACGEEGEGKLLDPDLILDQIFAELDTHPGSQKAVVVTGGATREPIDGVRFITNLSTGATASGLATWLANHGWKVTYLHGTGAIKSEHPSVCHLEFSDFKDLDRKMKSLLEEQSIDAFIQCAAVSDYSVAEIRSDQGAALSSHGKLDSDLNLTIELKRNRKLVEEIKKHSRNQSIRVVAFKLTSTPQREEQESAVRKLLNSGQVDWVVHNDMQDVTTATNRRDRHRFRIYSDKNVIECQNKTEMYEQLGALL